MYMYLSRYHYPLTHRAIRRERVRCNRERRWELQSSATLRVELRGLNVDYNLIELRRRGLVLPASGRKPECVAKE